MSESLVELAKRFPLTDKGTAHSYLEVYEELFAPLREEPLLILEIGVSFGDSLKLWDAYFPNAKVWGCDNDPGSYKDERVLSIDATDQQAVLKAFGPIQFDLIIEDASHRIWDQVAIYRNFRDRLTPGGLYVIEDIADLDTPPRIGNTPNRETYLGLDPSRKIELVDRRSIHNRWDDVLLIIRDQR